MFFSAGTGIVLYCGLQYPYHSTYCIGSEPAIRSPNYFQMYFHYKTTKCDDDRTVIDDSHKYDKPMEIILGKKFKLEIWETCLKTMLPNEVSEYLVDKCVSDITEFYCA